MDVLASAQHRSTADLVPRRRIDVLGSVVERLFSWQERVHVGKVPRQGLHPGRKVQLCSSQRYANGSLRLVGKATKPPRGATKVQQLREDRQQPRGPPARCSGATTKVRMHRGRHHLLEV